MTETTLGPDSTGFELLSKVEQPPSIDTLSDLKETADDTTNKIQHLLNKLHNLEIPVDKEKKELADLTKELRNLNNLTADSNLSINESEQFHDTSNETDGKIRVQEALQKLFELSETGNLFPTVGILGDSDSIEGHQIDLIHNTSKSSINVHFKMTAPMLERFINDILPNLPAEQLRDDFYNFCSSNGDIIELGNCWMIEVNENTSIRIAKAQKNKQGNQSKKKRNKKEQTILMDAKNTVQVPNIRTLIGAVQIEIRNSENHGETSQHIEEAFQTLSINQALEIPNEEAEKAYKKARLKWFHKLPDETAFEDYIEEYKQKYGYDLFDHLQRQEVFPGYYTIVDPGASERYQRDQEYPFILIHNISKMDAIPQILQNGLFSADQRYRRGCFQRGMSTMKDFDTGGADNVFLRLIPNDARFSFDITLLIRPEVLDRTDWYAYNSDQCGSTAPNIFDYRPSPEEFINYQLKFFKKPNEIMMRRGISASMFPEIVVKESSQRNYILKILQESGITEINGTSIENFISVHPDVKSYIESSRKNISDNNVSTDQGL